MNESQDTITVQVGSASVLTLRAALTYWIDITQRVVDVDSPFLNRLSDDLDVAKKLAERMNAIALERGWTTDYFSKPTDDPSSNEFIESIKTDSYALTLTEHEMRIIILAASKYSSALELMFSPFLTYANQFNCAYQAVRSVLFSSLESLISWKPGVVHQCGRKQEMMDIVMRAIEPQGNMQNAFNRAKMSMRKKSIWNKPSNN